MANPDMTRLFVCGITDESHSLACENNRAGNF